MWRTSRDSSPRRRSARSWYARCGPCRATIRGIECPRGPERRTLMADRFSAFSFVDRITALEPGRRARGRFAVPAGLSEFSTCLVAEAGGQLAAWVAMAQAEFRRRPVAALSGETRIVGEAAPGEILDLGVEIESCDPDAVADRKSTHLNSSH